MTQATKQPGRYGSLRRSRVTRVSIRLLTAIALLSLPTGGEARTTFIRIDQDEETRRADDELLSFLQQQSGGGERYELKTYKYETAIRRLADWDSAGDGHYLARVTPYVYVAAEMLGADFELLGTYESRATGKTTYHSYFVVRRADLEASGDRPLGPDDVLELLRRQATPAMFIYHNRFSTSSYLLPSLFFRKHRVFAMDESTHGGLTAIDSQQQGKGSTDLVHSVANSRGEQLLFAAVWDGTKSKFEAGGPYEETGRSLHFIRLPTELPNDVLVCSGSLPDERKEALRKSLKQMAPGREGEPDPIRSGDFKRWVEIYSSPEAMEAMEAMAGLRWQAREAPARVTVEIAPTTGLEAGEPDWVRAAAMHAVRLSGSELVVHDRDFHRQSDFYWSLEMVRRGHVVLTSEVADVKLATQVLRISYRPGESEREDLTQRLGELIHARLHRIRYLWPYEGDHPLVVRDLPFPLEKGSRVVAQEITWKDQLRNEYTGGESHSVQIAGSDAYKFRIDEDDARKLERKEAFDPMSNVSYRVVLVRPREPQGWFRVFAVTFYLLTFGALAGAVVAVRGPKATPAPASGRPE